MELRVRVLRWRARLFGWLGAAFRRRAR
jgi:hypothetical protein